MQRKSTATTRTTVTWAGQTFEPLEHDTYRNARSYVAEFVSFHATEAGCSSRRTAPDTWQIATPDELLTIAISHD